VELSAADFMSHIGFTMEQIPINSKACAANHVENKWEQERTGRIRIKNRRKSYLDQHPSYFNSPDLELAGLTDTWPNLLTSD
jgi:hypothetical protein